MNMKLINLFLVGSLWITIKSAYAHTPKYAVQVYGCRAQFAKDIPGTPAKF